MTAQSETHSEHSASGDGGSAATGGGGGGADDELLLAALLDGMDAALCAFDAEGVVTHWNREAERILGWTPDEAVGRHGLAGWAVLKADAPDIEARLLGARDTPGRQVHEFALMTKDGRRVLVRTQSSGVSGADGRPTGVYCAFSEVHAQIDLERSIALSEALLEDASWGVVIVDADLRPAVVNAHAARALGVSRSALLGRPLGELLEQGLEELEGAFQHVLAQGAPPAPCEIWVALRSSPSGDGRMGEARISDARISDARGPNGDAATRRCWRSGFLRLSSPLAEEPVPLGVAWLFQDITHTKRAERDASRTRFRDAQLHRAGRAAAECEDAMEAAALHLDFALAGFADHALLDLEASVMAAAPSAAAQPAVPSPGRLMAPTRLVRAAAAPVSAPGHWPPVEPGLRSGIPVGYGAGHPAVQAYERGGSVRTSVGGVSASVSEANLTADWAESRKWPHDTVHGLCAVLRSRGRTLGVATFLRGAGRRGFDRSDAAYAEDIAVRLATLVDLARSQP
ncbi:PAS domain S-box protein [Streptomyces sp. N2-109]|uniref:PAS domain S-box protein n=1 Tax=Streptomyces gossypii TaxID=2883101 RepID=A0ABT2JXR9_9ACTN|nr:PAS domain S-box protein [Streptomyces gossypii]MCT2592671.1 PAS domain S-box protein [Streptomyces gossypii]